jgi:ribosomal protein L19
VPGKHRHGVIQGQQFLANAIEEEVLVSAGNVPPADTPSKKHVSTNDNLLIDKVKAQAPRAVARHMVDAQWRSEQFGLSILVEKEIGLEGIDFESESPVAEEVGVADHGGGGGVKGGFATVALDNRCSIDDMIEVSMGEHKQVDLFAGKCGIRTLRRIEKNSALRRLIVKAIGVEYTAGEAFEPIHEKMVREMMSRFDFRGAVCKLLRSSI